MYVCVCVWGGGGAQREGIGRHKEGREMGAGGGGGTDTQREGIGRQRRERNGREGGGGADRERGGIGRHREARDMLWVCGGEWGGGADT